MDSGRQFVLDVFSRADYTGDDVRRVIAALTDRGTFHFPQLATGLFSAAAGQGDDFAQSGYQSVWVRDTIHIAHVHWVIGETKVAVKAVTSLLEFLLRNRQRLDDILSGAGDHNEPMQRPHIRFDGNTLTELDEKWAHAQNDALGYLLWFACRLIRTGALEPTPDQLGVLTSIVKFFGVVEYWRDEDSGHWEEVRKIAASSIGAALAGLNEYRELIAAPHSLALRGAIDSADLEALLAQGRAALKEILPWECRQANPLQRRRYDAALLFLIYPLEIVDGPVADQIAADVIENLQGPHGIRRYPGDSYWCADYKRLLSADTRTADFSDDLGSRDRLLQPGTEAQWCIFDPILSVIFAKKYLASRQPRDLQRHRDHLLRSLRQLTTAETGFPLDRCPESYYCENGTWTPNDITPLLWTQANVRVALEFAEQVAREA